MRIIAILAIAALSWFGEPPLAQAAADFATGTAQTIADASADFDWGSFNPRLKLALVLAIMAAISGLAHLANREKKLQDDLVPARVR